MQICEHISWKILKEKVVAVDINTGIYYTMNEQAGDIWQALADGLSEADILEKMKADYPDVAPETLEADLREQLEEWRKENLVQ